MLWLYFLGILILLGILTFIGFLSIKKQPSSDNNQTDDKSLKINEDELKKVEDFQYLGTPIDLESGFGKKDPFK